MIDNINIRVSPAYPGGKETAAVKQTKEQALTGGVKPQNTDSYVPENETPALVPEDSVTYKPNTALVEQLKLEQEQIQARFITMVQDMLTKQGKVVGGGDEIWKILASGDFSVDAETKTQAQQAIAEDGYWGSDQTSQRIVGFAKALVGGDPSRVEEMRDAFMKGFQQAEEAWGGTLPPWRRTYDKAMELFDQWAQEGKAPESAEPPAEGGTK